MPQITDSEVGREDTACAREDLMLLSGGLSEAKPEMNVGEERFSRKFCYEL